MRVAVTGSRNFHNKELVREVLSHYTITTLIHGGATGLDSIAESWATENGIHIERYEADWDTYGPMAGPVRNSKMLKKGKPNILIAFLGGKGTANCRAQAAELGIPVIVIQNSECNPKMRNTMDKNTLYYAQYAQKVAEKLQLETIEKLESIYGDLVMDCYMMEDTVDKCCFYCQFDGDEGDIGDEEGEESLVH